MRILYFFLICIVIQSSGMQTQNSNFLLPANQKVTAEIISATIAVLAKLPLSKMKGSKQMLSETLYILSAQWDESIADQGIQLAELLMEKGADPDYKKIVPEYLHAGSSSVRKTIVVDHKESPTSVAQGALLKLFMQKNK
ncbi:hypothetical protein BH09DEP1_BH09DEP1_5640 [soil metagenome]